MLEMLEEKEEDMIMILMVICKKSQEIDPDLDIMKLKHTEKTNISNYNINLCKNINLNSLRIFTDDYYYSLYFYI